MNRIIDVTTQVKDQVFTDDAHQVVANHAHIVIRRVFTDKGIDSGKPLGHSTASFHGCFVDQQNALVVR